MFYRMTVFSLALTTASLVSAVCGCVQTPELKAALNQVQPALVAYREQTSREEQENFVKYLNYYRAEGGYQAVTPAPKQLRDSLTPASVELFRKIKLYAAPLIKSPTGVPGASTLSPQANAYYQEVLKLLRAALIKRD